MFHMYLTANKNVAEKKVDNDSVETFEALLFYKSARMLLYGSKCSKRFMHPPKINTDL
jgi:hypothetical protein